MMVGRMPLGGEPPSLFACSFVASVVEKSNISLFIHRFETFHGTALHEMNHDMSRMQQGCSKDAVAPVEEFGA